MCETTTAIVNYFEIIRRETEVAKEYVVFGGEPPIHWTLIRIRIQNLSEQIDAPTQTRNDQSLERERRTRPQKSPVSYSGKGASPDAGQYLRSR